MSWGPFHKGGWTNSEFCHALWLDPYPGCLLKVRFQFLHSHFFELLLSTPEFAHSDYRKPVLMNPRYSGSLWQLWIRGSLCILAHWNSLMLSYHGLELLVLGEKHWFGSKTQRDDVGKNDWNGTEHILGLYLGQIFWKQHKIKIQEHISRFAQSTLETCSAVMNRLVDINLMCHWPGNKKRYCSMKLIDLICNPVVISECFHDEYATSRKVDRIVPMRPRHGRSFYSDSGRCSVTAHFMCGTDWEQLPHFREETVRNSGFLECILLLARAG